MKTERKYTLGPTLLSVIAAFMYSSSVNADVRPPDFLENLPPWEIYEAPPQSVQVNPPVYLDTDGKGNVYRRGMFLNKEGQYEIREELMSIYELDQLSKENNIILRDGEAAELATELSKSESMAQRATSSTCPLPSSFSLISNSVGESQNVQQVTYTSRPAGATTQWVVFDFYTEDYRGSASHVPVALFFEHDLHGWGALFGDNHDHPTSNCGTNALFNSQIEGFLTIGASSQPEGPTNQNWVFDGPNSCGNEMYDGAVMVVPYHGVPKYRFEMQASTGHWVAYRIFEYVLTPGSGGWEVLTDWKVIDVDTGDWKYPGTPDLPWLTDSEGISFSATDSVPAVTDDWKVHISNVTCGWF